MRMLGLRVLVLFVAVAFKDMVGSRHQPQKPSGLWWGSTIPIALLMFFCCLLLWHPLQALVLHYRCDTQHVYLYAALTHAARFTQAFPTLHQLHSDI